MARISIPLLLFVILGSAYCGHSGSCEMLAFMACRNPSNEAAFRNLNGNFPGEAFLKENCDALIEQLDCLLEQEKTCPLGALIFEESEERFKGLLGLKQLVDDVCDQDSSFRKDYLESTACLDEHKNDLVKDMDALELMVIQFNQHYNMENEEDSIANEILQCVKFAFTFNEVKNTIEKYCGSVASNAFVTIANHIAVLESEKCLEDQENVDRLTELLESFRPSDENIYFNSIE